MFDPQFLPERCSTDRSSAASQVRKQISAAVRWAVAKPAKSAIMTIAIGAIVGSVVRMALVRDSGPNQAAAADQPAKHQIDARPTR